MIHLQFDQGNHQFGTVKDTKYVQQFFQCYYIYIFALKKQCIKYLDKQKLILKVITRNNMLYLKDIKYEKLYEALNIFNE